MKHNFQNKFIIASIIFIFSQIKINAQCSGLITGRITNKEKAVSNLTIKFVLSDNSIYTTTTDGEGRYQLPTIPTNNFEIVKIIPEITLKPPHGVSTLDMVFIFRHILGLQKFDKSFQYLAADATNDGKITAGDLVEIRSLILGINLKYTNSDFVIFNHSNNTFPIQITDCNVTTNNIYDIEIVVVGDVNP